MPKVISSGLQSEFDSAVPTVGYLLRWNGTQTLRWCSWGDTTYEGVPWIEYDFRLENLGFSADKARTATLRVQNMDNLAAAFFSTEPTAEVTIDVWIASPSALTTGAASYLAKMVVGDCEIGADYMVVRLVESVSQFAHSPRRRIDAVHGFNYALPPGSRITWEAENYIVEAEDG